MQIRKIALAETRSFSSFFLDYIQQKKTLQKFYHRFPSIDQFKDQINEKSKAFTDENRNILADVLQSQYQDLKPNDLVSQNINLLRDKKTFTVTTGHQLNIFTGPLYFIFKIVTVINTCKKLKEAYPDYNFVPVYWMASEDHDYDEIKYFKLYGKKYIWETDQQGAVGRFSTDGLTKLIEQVPGDTQVFKNAYSKYKTLSDAVRCYVNELFEKEGLVVIDADHRSLKSLFKTVIKDDLVNHTAKSIVDKTDQELNELGYKTQVHCRDINFFYLDTNLRSRIEKHDDAYQVVDTSIKFTSEQINTLIENEPEKFSPNVILRPLYQEIILPNIAYVGGPAEVIYWLQLKEVFNHYQTPFPILMPRNFGMVMDHTIARKFAKTKLELKDLFEEKNYLFNHWVIKNTQNNLTVGVERNTIQDIFQKLKERSGIIDPTLAPYVGAEGKRAMNSIERIEQKLLRAEKRLHSDKLRQIEDLKNSLFPGGSLQERTDNFLNFYQQDAAFIEKLLTSFDPLDFKFNILLSEIPHD
jgi:bacillithiol biosynthesis cysteine-adding enzyme BshC